ncbi:hypothetical protein [Crocinitomix algicola]|uniref:hypothetical protein n=1 Tax=Crocinitomix algicola TaxID=1740263 RepID=UPI000832464E|nr:hypothetical protein [Crocinitomix algicola]
MKLLFLLLCGVTNNFAQQIGNIDFIYYPDVTSGYIVWDSAQSADNYDVKIFELDTIISGVPSYDL